MANGTKGQTSVPAEVGSNDLFGGWLSANAGKIVAGGLAPVFAWLSPVIAGFANKVFQLHLSSQQVSNVGIAIIAGLALMGYKWLSNRGEWERAVLDIQKVYLAGQPSVPGAGGNPDPAAGNPNAGAGGAGPGANPGAVNPDPPKA